MLPQATYNSFRLLTALSLLAMLLVATPRPAQAAGAAPCSANRAEINRALHAQESTPNHAGLVIDFGDGRVMTFCIDLGADGQATGEEFLRASNLPVIIDYGFGMGGAICKIDNVGSDFPAEPCFSHCTFQPGEACAYWVYSQLVGDHWQFLQVGAGGTAVHSGDVYGWAWGESTIQNGAKPPVRTLAEICPPATATPTTTLTPTPTITPTATLPPVAAPPATTTPYVVRIITATPTVSQTPTSTPTAALVAATVVPAQSTAPIALPAPSPNAPPLPTAMPNATPFPSPTGTALADTSSATLPAPTPANRSAGGSTRIQLPLIQHSVAATPSAATRPTAPVESAPARLPSATLAPLTATPTPRPSTPADDPTRNYPYFGGTAAFLLAGWALLRRGRARSGS